MRVYSTRPFALGLLLMSGQRLAAQSVGRMIGYDVSHAFGDIVGTWVAPLHSSGRDWFDAGIIVAGGAAISPWDDNIDNWFVRNHDSNVWSALGVLREGGDAFSGRTITPVAAGVYVVGLVTKSQGIRDGVWGCVASYVAESVVRSQVMYRVVGRVRPDSVRGDHESRTEQTGRSIRVQPPRRQ